MKAYLAKLFSNHPTDEGGNKLGPASLPLSGGDSMRPVFGHALSLPLPEYIELRGYIPFRDYEVLIPLSVTDVLSDLLPRDLLEDNDLHVIPLRERERFHHQASSEYRRVH
jgi:hypothetical protein